MSFDWVDALHVSAVTKLNTSPKRCQRGLLKENTVPFLTT